MDKELPKFNKFIMHLVGGITIAQGADEPITVIAYVESIIPDTSPSHRYCGLGGIAVIDREKIIYVEGIKD